MGLLRTLSNLLAYPYDRKINKRKRTTVPNDFGYFRNVGVSNRIQDEEWVWVDKSTKFARPLYLNVREIVDYNYVVTLDASPSPNAVEAIETRSPIQLTQTLKYVRNYYGEISESIKYPDGAHVERMVQMQSKGGSPYG